MKSYIAWVILVGMVLGFVTVIGAIMGEMRWSEHERPYVIGLDQTITRAQEKVPGGEMLKELEMWLSSFERLEIASSYEPVRARVMNLRNELLAPGETPSATLLKREKVRTQLGTIPLIGAKSFSELHSFWGYLLRGVGIIAAVLSLIPIGIYLILRSAKTPGSITPTTSGSLSISERGYCAHTSSSEQENVAAQVFATAMMNEEGRRNYESRRF